LAFLAAAGWTLAAAAAPEDGQKFDDWTIRCNDNPQNAATGGCVMFQAVVNKETNRAIMQVAIGYLAQEQVKTPAAVITLPLGVRLPPGVIMQVDEKDSTNFPFERCLPEGCMVQFRLTADQIAVFKGGTAGKFTFQHASGQPVAIPFSLKGFTAALTALTN